MDESTKDPVEPGTGSDRAPEGGGPAGLSRATLAFGGALLATVGFLGGYVVKDATADERGFDRGMMVGPDGVRGPMGPGGAGGPMGGGPGNVTFGTVTSVDGSTVTLTTADGDTATVSVDADARVMVTTRGSAKDLAKGDQIVVHGQRDGDTIDADVIAKGGMFAGKAAAGAGAR